MSKTEVILNLPEEFVLMCQKDNVDPDVVLRGFIADVAGIVNTNSSNRTDGYTSHGSDERLLAKEYYRRVGYSALNFILKK